MMCGERQLSELRTSIGNHVLETLMSEGQLTTPRAPERPRHLETTSAFTWSDGTQRSVPESFEVSRKGAKVVDIWNLWWQGYWDGGAKVKPYKFLFYHHRKDIREAYCQREKSPETARRAMVEITAVMAELENVCDHEMKGEYEELLTQFGTDRVDILLLGSLWNKYWPIVLQKIHDNFDQAEAAVSTGRKRKHDYSRCPLRTIFKKLKLIK